MEQKGSSHRRFGRGSDVPRSPTFQAEVACHRSSDGDFLLAESQEVRSLGESIWDLSDVEAHSKIVRWGSSILQGAR